MTIREVLVFSEVSRYLRNNTNIKIIMIIKIKFTSMFLCAIAALTISCNQPGSKQSESKSSGLSSDSVIALAEQAYVLRFHKLHLLFGIQKTNHCVLKAEKVEFIKFRS